MTKPPKDVFTLPLEVRAEMALTAAVERLIIDHARTGSPMYVWRDGKVVGVPVEEMRERAAQILAE